MTISLNLHVEEDAYCNGHQCVLTCQRRCLLQWPSVWTYKSEKMPIAMAPNSTPPIKIMLAFARASSLPHTRFVWKQSTQAYCLFDDINARFCSDYVLWRRSEHLTSVIKGSLCALSTRFVLTPWQNLYKCSCIWGSIYMGFLFGMFDVCLCSLHNSLGFALVGLYQDLCVIALCCQDRYVVKLKIIPLT